MANESRSAPFTYKPPARGDITLKSADGTTFLAHSVLLGMASSVFADMLSTATQSDAVELSDDAESVSLMLRFIYPPTFLEQLPLPLLEKSLRIAQKYDTQGVITSIDHLIAFDALNNTTGPVHTDTIRMFCLAKTYDLPKTKKTAAKALYPDEFHFNRSAEIMPLAQQFPTAATPIGILGAHCVRTRALWELLLSDDLEYCQPVFSPNTSFHRVMICSNCIDQGGYEFSQDLRYEPGWLVYWATMAFNRLSNDPYSECTSLFIIDSLCNIDSRPGVCQDCIEVTRVVKTTFHEWARHIQIQVQKIIDDVEPLYNL